jgi:hypothetical protein
VKLRFQQQDGVALITALLAVIILAGLASVFVARAIAETRASGTSQRWETTIHTGEAAADVQIAALNASDTHVTEDLVGPVTMPDSARVDEDAEETWALGLLDDMRGTDAWVEDELGESYAVRPRGSTFDDDGNPITGPLDVIYAVGATPGFGEPRATVRVMKLQVAQDAFVPQFALLTNGALKFGGNAAIVHPDCVLSQPETCIADVHTNSTATNPGTSSTIHGQLSVAGGTCPSVTAVNGCVADGVQPMEIPEFSARGFYLRDADVLNNDPSGQDVEWLDLCPDGTVKSPAAGGPCTGTQLWPNPSNPDAGSFLRGWEWRPSQNTWRASALQAGVFYVHHADAQVTGSSGTDQRAVSILVSSDPANPSGSGSLEISGNPKLQAALSDVLFITDRDLDMAGNATGGTGDACGNSGSTFSGFIGVGEQLDVAGTVNLRGAAIVRDADDLHNLVKRNNASIQGTMCLEYDDNLAVDLTGIWVVTFWNEL